MDTKLKDLIINELTEEKLKELEDTNAIPPNELFVTEDEDEDEALIIDEALNANSENPVANKAITQKFNEIEPSVLFAEAERQKSKNLFDISRVKLSSSVSVDSENNSFTFTAFSTYTNNKLKDFADLEVGKTYRLIGTTTSSNKAIYLSSVSQYWYFNNTITITQEMLDSSVGFYGTTDVAVTISEVMITEGTNEESYQPYHGAIVHEKDTYYLKQYPIQCSLKMTADQNNLAAYSNATVIFGRVDFSTDTLGLIKHNNGILSFDKRVKKVRLHGHIALGNTGTKDATINVYRNDSELLGYLASKTSSGGQICEFETPVIELSENDTIRTTVFCEITCSVYYWYSRLNVEVYV